MHYYRFANKISILIKASNTASLANLPEHIIRQISSLTANASAVGMCSYYRGLSNCNNIPKRLIADMANINEHSQALCFADKDFS